MAGTDPPEAFCDSARAVWSNAVIREAIIERAPISVLVTLLRVDRDALRRAVGQLYRSIRDEPALKARLMDVRNSTRFSCYTQAVRHLDNLAWPNFNISILRQQYPQLRSFSALSGLTEFGSCKWDVDDHGHAVDVVFTLDSWGRKAFWGRRVEGVKRVLPDDWNIAFRPREVHLKSADDINRWIAESEAGTIGVPALIGIFWLAESELAILHDYIRSRGWGRQDIDLKVDLRDEGGKVTVPSDIATSDKLRQTLLAWKGIPKSLELYGVEWQAETLSVWSHLLAAYPRLKLELTSAPWSKQRMPSRHFATRISEMFNLSTLPKRVDVNVGLDIYSDDFPAPTGRKDAVRTIMQDRTWIHDLARTLLALAGPLGRHAVTIGPKDYWRPNGFDPDICGAHFHINELITTLLNDTIATIVECRREDMPAGFHRLERHDHKHPSGVSSPVGD